ncbi:MAG: response regulator [Marinobacter sp.]|uniref:response regulator n=1 Tax=Marinobacter sp. TaxID=50741 RepID=UPI0034A053F3
MHSLQLFKKSRAYREEFDLIPPIDQSANSNWLDRYYNYLFYIIVIGVPVISALFWTSFENLGLAPAEPWLSLYVPASIFIAVMAMLLAFAGWIYRMQRMTRAGAPAARMTPTIPLGARPEAEPFQRKDTSAVVAPKSQREAAVSDLRNEAPQSMGQEPARRLKVLVADDDACNRMTLRKQLLQLGVESKSAQDGMAAVEAAMYEHWDLILMDGQMPNMDGIEAAKQIRTNSRVNADTAIIAVTSNTCHGYRERCLASGMNGFCSKPLNADGLQQLIENYVKKEES